MADDVIIDDHVSIEALEQNLDDVPNEATSGHIDDEATIMGTAPVPAADDDTLQNSHLMGLRLDETEENPQELNIAQDMAAAEKARRGPPEEPEE